MTGRRIGRFLTALFFISSAVLAVRMSPAVFVARDVPIGKLVDLEVPLVLSPSEGEGPKSLIARVLSPEEAVKQPLSGYKHIPEGVFIVEGEQPILISKEAPALRRLFVDFPDNPAFYNRHFFVQLWVSQDGAGGNIQSAIVATYMIETESRAEAKTGGLPIAISPSVLELDEAGSGYITITNNDTIMHSIKCRTANIEQSSHAVAISLTPGFEAGDATKFTIPADSFLLGPGEKKLILVTTYDKEYLKSIGKNIEFLFWAELPNLPGSARFVRVRISPK